jgi:hypothetical protein
MKTSKQFIAFKVTTLTLLFSLLIFGFQSCNDYKESIDEKHNSPPSKTSTTQKKLKKN